MANPVGHCNWESGGALATNELPVPNLSVASLSIQTPSGGLGHGNVRGAFVFLHGLQSVNPSIPFAPQETAGALPVHMGTMATSLLADGWVVIQPIFQEDNSNRLNPAVALYQDVNNDSGDGSRYLASTLHHWEHMLDFIQKTYPSGFPICIFGFSAGAWRAVSIAASRLAPTIKAFGAHCPATIWSNIGSSFNPPGLSWSALNATGLLLSTTCLNSCTVPGVIGYHTSDMAVGYSAAGTGGTPVSNTQSIISNASGASSPPVGVSNPDGSAGNHVLTTGDASYYTGTWVAGTGPTAPDVLCPKSF